MRFTQLLKQKQEDNFGTKAPVIAFLGDSVTQGCFEIYRSGEMLKTIFDNRENYANKVQEILSVLYPEAPVSIINAGINGGTAAEALDRLERDVLCHNPDLVVVCFGLNDSNADEDGVKWYADNLSEIFAKIKANGAEIIFMTPNMMNTKLSRVTEDEIAKNLSDIFANRQLNGLFDKYIESAKKVCEEQNIPVCDCYAIWKKMYECGVDTTELLCNGLNHPSRKMHYLFATELVKTIFFS